MVFLSVCLSVLLMAVIPAKVAEPIKLTFGGGRLAWTHVLDEGGTTSRIQLNDPCSLVTQAVTTITVVTVWLRYCSN